jgi:hypothetical protein
VHEQPVPSPLESLADAASEHRRAEVASLRASEVKIGAAYSLIVLLMNLWAGLLYAAGLLAAVFTLISFGQGDPFFQRQTTGSGGFRARGRAIGLVLGVAVLLLSKFQTRLAERLRERKLREARMALGFTEPSSSSPSSPSSLPPQ